MTLDLFAALEARDEAIERADARVATSVGGDALVGRVTERLVRLASFTADDVGVILDEMGVDKDQHTRRRLVGTVVNRGKGKLWTVDGYTTSHDPRRHARPVMRWRVLDTRKP